MDKAGFGYCSNEGECEKHCPKEIKLTNIARMNRHFLLASLLENE
jgi:succinate dehydrogenase / fumarate reductase iron-sulfur subunit